jgi:hypothetical protein
MISEVIAASVAIIVAVITYSFTKKREREAELRKEKLDHYKNFVDSLTGILGGEGTSDGQMAFSRASNNLSLFAPQATLRALYAFQDGIKTTNVGRSQEQHDALLSTMLFEIRKDLGVSPSNNDPSFKFRLWGSGTRPDGRAKAPHRHNSSLT